MRFNHFLSFLDFSIRYFYIFVIRIKKLVINLKQKIKRNLKQKIPVEWLKINFYYQKNLKTYLKTNFSNLDSFLIFKVCFAFFIFLIISKINMFIFVILIFCSLEILLDTSTKRQRWLHEIIIPKIKFLMIEKRGLVFLGFFLWFFTHFYLTIKFIFDYL
jgi:hypothetical protein